MLKFFITTKVQNVFGLLNEWMFFPPFGIQKRAACALF